jgi:hypothetical protein
MFHRLTLTVLVFVLLCSRTGWTAEPTVDFNRDIRPILSNICFRCHGPDDNERKGELRLDQRSAAIDDSAVIVPGEPESSELVARITAEGDERMPPIKSGLELTQQQVELLSAWVEQGAEYAGHWSYEPPLRPELPQVSKLDWVNNPIDRFVLARLDREQLTPAAVADRYSLARRLSLDLTGLPPTVAEVDAFVADDADSAYERYVDRLLASKRYGERWAAMWLDLARYADSAGYADDPPRTIWLYRDWVIQAINDNLPFDRFTIDQIAGDMLEDASQSQLVATAFHRNTLTNSEGGTDDEEFRNVAIVDRINTTMQVWMGTTVRCAQCHNHKYDAISQREYFQLFAFLNNTEDADRRDESPLLSVMPESQKQQKAGLEAQLAELKQQLTPDAEALAKQLQAWRLLANRDYEWLTLKPMSTSAAAGTTLELLEDGSILASGAEPAKETYTLEFESDLAGITGVRIEALAHDSLPGNGPGLLNEGNFVLSGLSLQAGTAGEQTRAGRFVRVDLPGAGKMIHLAEVEVMVAGKNVAPEGTASQSSTGFEGPAKLANDGNTDGEYANKSVSHTAVSENPWWEVDLGEILDVGQIVIWNRTDNNLQSRLDGYKLTILDADREPVWTKTFAKAPQTDQLVSLDGLQPVTFNLASANHEQAEQNNALWSASLAVSQEKKGPEIGWAIAPRMGESHAAIFQLTQPLGKAGETTRLQLVLAQDFDKHALGHFRVSVTMQAAPVQLLPDSINELVARLPAELTVAERQLLVDYYLQHVPPPKEVTDKIAAIQKQIDGIKMVTVPVMRELAIDKRRTTKIQVRGNFLITEDEVSEATPAVLHAFPADQPVDRLGLARWLVSRDNPLTARVVVNRYWEQLFGIGLVATSEEFGTQGELPTHPGLLDWLAVEFMEDGWDVKQLLKVIVMSATYRQSSAVTAEAAEADPDNQLLARGPRFRLSAEMIRDQALATAGLLSPKMFGPSVQPPRPNLGLKAAFGGSTDWQTSPGEDKYRRGLYTSWRRSIPYPSMATFDAPSRNVCTIRRGRTNTPLQALVTLNDPVYVEAAQALARRMYAHASADIEAQLVQGFRICLARPPLKQELTRLVQLYDQLLERYRADKELAMQMATSLVGPVPEGADVSSLAALTIVGNVLLNLDETLSKR